MTSDVPNTFIQMDVPKSNGYEARVIMKNTGVIVDLVMEMEPEVIGTFVIYENGGKVLYIQVLKFIYGFMVASLI